MSTFRTVALTVALSFVASLATFIGAYKYLPLGFFEHAPLLGATAITTIQGSDTLSASRTTINDNFSSLNANKVEIEDLAATTSLTALAKIGTITTGTWNASIISTAFGGTGSTTLSQFSVLLGSSTNPVGIVSGLGTTGQYLTSNGDGQAPSWQTAAIDQAANYTWTGNHNFTGNTYIKNLFASSTLTISNGGAGVSYVLPTSNPTLPSYLYNDNSGTLIWASATSTKGTIANNTDVPDSSGGGTNTDTVVTHGLGRIPTEVEISATIQARGDTNNDNVWGNAKYDSYGVMVTNLIHYIGTAVSGTTGASAFSAVGEGTSTQTITISVISITSTTFTFRINGVITAGAPAAGTVSQIGWIAR